MDEITIQPDYSKEHVTIVSKNYPYSIQCPCGFRYGSASRKFDLDCINCDRHLKITISSKPEGRINIITERKK